MTEPMNFAPKPSVEWSDNFESVIDLAMQADNAAQPSRNYLGASRLGDECSRKLAFEYHKTPKDEGREFKGRTLRIFQRGHTGEDNMAARLRLAGFKLVTHKADGGQIGFTAAGNRVSGHIDGVVTEAPYAAGLATPALWESKCLGEKSFSDLVKKGVRASKPVYFVQMQLYMAYLDLAEHPALFTAENANTGAIYAERVPFDAAAAQAASDKGVAIVQTQDPTEMPRVAKVATDFRCKWCDYSGKCWGAEGPAYSDGRTFEPWSFGAAA